VDIQKVANALRALADGLEAAGAGLAVTATAPAAPEAPAAAPEAAPVKRPRGRPAKVEAPATPAPEASPVVEATPAVAPQVVTATLEDVRAALTALKAATDQATALKVLHRFAENFSALKPEQYSAVIEATKQPVEVEEDDPFAAPPAPAAPAAPPAPPAKVYTRDEVKAAIIAAVKRSGQDVAQKVVMTYGGTAPDPVTGTQMPSLKALPEAKFAAVIAELQALPATK
jgi:hypothetical protein